MKNLKNYAMALVALVIAISTLTLMSFKQLSANEEWHEFTPGTATPNPLDPSQYTSIGSTPPSECEDGTTVCAIKTPEGQPLNAQYLQDLENQGQMSGPSANENVRFKF